MTLTDYFRFPSQCTSKAQQGTPRHSDKAGPHRTEITPPGLASPVASLASSQNETCKKALGRQAIASTSCFEEKTSKEKYEEKRR